MTESRDLPPPPAISELTARAQLALFLDFDGTLVPIAATPDGIAVPDDLAARIEGLADRFAGRLALVSGRAIDNLCSHLGPTAVAIAGSHGAHRQLADGSLLGGKAAEISDAVVAAMRDFASRESLHLEEKAHGSALHYRSAPEKKDVVAAAMDQLAAANGLATKHGKCVVELVEPGADKGAAVEAFMALPLFDGSTPVFIGDDVTDEDGFAAANRLGGFGIRIDGDGPTLARYRLPDPDSLYDWLDL
ncbi:trehalose-phosphatase [Altererythrobacter sp. ZODW24]|uniref:trehalose-phosphatase n=1 Tax=Altererythrobacter sp. ZODW24 TaxID=2185142 RepID=UPI000DF82970|nr:trehalose-phosphatase [Altererythrobacter sp. ZODW24]